MNLKKIQPLLIKGHILFAGFFLPAAVTFAITGGLYTFGIRGDYETKSLAVNLSTLNSDPGVDELTTAARSILQDNFQAPTPSGSPGVRKAGTSWQFEWTGARADFTLEPTAEQGVYKATFKQTGWHRFFVQLHKAKGGWPFRVLAGGLAVAFLFLFASGVGMAVVRPMHAPLLRYSLLAGSTTFLLCLFLS